MISKRSTNQPDSEIHLFEENKEISSKWVKVSAIVCALAVAAALVFGYRFLHARQLARVRVVQQTEQALKRSAPPEAQIFENEAKLKGSEALITGTIRNISDEKLEALSLEIELKRRTAQNTERRRIDIEPADLGPGEEGRYSLSLLSSEWSGARVLSLNSARRNGAIAFKTAVGARRQPERLPQGNPKIVLVPKPKPKGEEFINTPDTPIRIP